MGSLFAIRRIIIFSNDSKRLARNGSAAEQEHNRRNFSVPPVFPPRDTGRNAWNVSRETFCAGQRLGRFAGFAGVGEDFFADQLFRQVVEPGFQLGIEIAKFGP